MKTKKEIKTTEQKQTEEKVKKSKLYLFKVGLYDFEYKKLKKEKQKIKDILLRHDEIETDAYLILSYLIDATTKEENIEDVL